MRRPGRTSVLRCHNRSSRPGMGGLMRRYRLLEQPLPPGLTTLRDYADRLGYSSRYIRQYWGQRDGFPEPVGELPSQGRLGRGSGGPGELVYEEKALNAFRARHADPWGRPRMQRVVTHR